MSIYERGNCIIENCKLFGRNKGLMHGKRFYGNVCEIHHRGKNGNDVSRHIISRIENKVCENCGWKETFCDRHRLNPNLGYTRENIKILCPNCHRLTTEGLLSF